MSRAQRIKQLMIDEGYSRKEAQAWADFEHDYKPTQNELRQLLAEVDTKANASAR